LLEPLLELSAVGNTLFHDNLFYVPQAFERAGIVWPVYWWGCVLDVREILVQFTVGAKFFSSERSDRL